MNRWDRETMMPKPYAFVLQLPHEFMDKLIRDWERLLTEEKFDKPEMISGVARYAAETLIPAHRDGLKFLNDVIEDLMKHGKPKDEDKWRYNQIRRVMDQFPEWIEEVRAVHISADIVAVN